MTSGIRPPQEQLKTQGLRRRDIRESLIERVWKGYLYMALVSIPAAILRIWITGWRPLYTVHVCVATIVLICFSLRKKSARHIVHY